MEYSNNFCPSQPNENERERYKKCETKVLLIEDNTLIQFIYHELLNQLGCQITTAASGEEALFEIDNDYDVILLDIGLPGINGITVAEKLRNHQKHKKTKIIITTTYDQENIRSLCCHLNIDVFLSKPVSIQDLATAIGY